MDQHAGLIGLGNAGMALAAPILKQYSIAGFDLDPARCAIAADMGVKIAVSARALAQQCEIILLSLPNPAISKSVLTAIGAASLTKRVVIETSTVTPEDTLRTAQAIAGAKVTVMDQVGHFPMSENPAQFRKYLLPVLEEIVKVTA